MHQKAPYILAPAAFSLDARVIAVGEEISVTVGAWECVVGVLLTIRGYGLGNQDDAHLLLAEEQSHQSQLGDHVTSFIRHSKQRKDELGTITDGIRMG